MREPPFLAAAASLRRTAHAEAERDRAVHGVRYTNFTLRGCQ